jgi:hypothetical protein
MKHSIKKIFRLLNLELVSVSTYNDLQLNRKQRTNNLKDHEGGPRSYKRFDGVHVFKTRQDVMDLIQSPLDFPAMPAVPVKAFDYFQESLRHTTRSVDQAA